MAECGAPYHNADVTGLYCNAPEGHGGPHEAVTYIYWDDDERAPVPATASLANRPTET